LYARSLRLVAANGPSGSSPKNLKRQLGENVPRQRQQLRDRRAGADPPFLAAQEVHHRERLVGPGHDVECIVLTFPKETRIRPSFTRRSAGKTVRVR